MKNDFFSNYYETLKNIRTSSTTFTYPNYFGSDIKETENGYHIFIPVPGFTKDEIQVEVDDNLLIVKSKTERELPSCVFNVSKSYLVENIDHDTLDAKLENGILEITFSISKKNIRSYSVK